MQERAQSEVELVESVFRNLCEGGVLILPMTVLEETIYLVVGDGQGVAKLMNEPFLANSQVLIFVIKQFAPTFDEKILATLSSRENVQIGTYNLEEMAKTTHRGALIVGAPAQVEIRKHLQELASVIASGNIISECPQTPAMPIFDMKILREKSRDRGGKTYERPVKQTLSKNQTSRKAKANRTTKK